LPNSRHLIGQRSYALRAALDFRPAWRRLHCFCADAAPTSAD
jgi:hypothetical protein